MINWFPLASKLYTREDFNNLPVTAKVYFLELISQSNYYNGKFYKPDAYFAMKFSVSTKTIRRHRKKLSKIGLINIEPGKLGKGGQNLATKYLKVRYSNDKDCPTVDDYINFARIHRYSFNRMLQTKEININDIWIWLTLWWWKQNHPTEDNNFFITKKELKRLTGYGQVLKSVKNIYNNITFKGGSKLYDYINKYHKIEFKNWSFWEDPLEGSNTDTFESEIQGQLEQKRKQEETKDLKGFLKHFKSGHKTIHNKKCNVSSYQKKLVNQLLDKYGLKTLKKMADRYFYSDDNMPKPTGTNRKSLARFTSLIQEGYFNLSD